MSGKQILQKATNECLGVTCRDKTHCNISKNNFSHFLVLFLCAPETKQHEKGKFPIYQQACSSASALKFSTPKTQKYNMTIDHHFPFHLFV